ncbi:MAG: LicD family protein [Lachnospiraceae bacterium]|jgi:lipopolysaccharide cholinephosphotransferase|nr:LicD family protein [Lachnospiraceae bacterium]
MISLDNVTLRSLQMIQLELLLEVDRICKKNAIAYNIIAGTLLGAVRHQGYIPWDDDADVAFLREEYERFREACKKDLDRERFYFQDHRNTPGYRWGYGKLRRKETQFIREHQEFMPYEQGVFIDIFPLDQVPDSYPGRMIHNFHCFAIRKILWSEVGKTADRSLVMRGLYGLLSCIPERVVFRHYYHFMREGNRKKTKWVRILTFPTPNKQYGYRKIWYQKSKLYQFEGHSFPGAKDYKEYLTFKFGDYMTLPPAHLRKTHPVSSIKLS